METTGTVLDALRGVWAGLVASKNDTLFFSLVMLAVTTALAVLSRTLQGIVAFVGGRRERRRKRLRACVDFYIDCALRVKDARTVFTRQTGETLKAQIDGSPRNLRFYVASVVDQTIFDNMKEHRHLFRRREIALIDEYILHAKVFDVYYRKTESEEFGDLSRERKKAVIDELMELSGRVDRTAMAMSTGIPYFRRLGGYLSPELATLMDPGARDFRSGAASVRSS